MLSYLSDNSPASSHLKSSILELSVNIQSQNMTPDVRAGQQDMACSCNSLMFLMQEMKKHRSLTITGGFVEGIFFFFFYPFNKEMI